MTADLKTIDLQSIKFAQLITREHGLDTLNDGTLYVITGNNPQWEEMVEKIKVHIQGSIFAPMWHLPYNIVALKDLYILEKDEILMQHAQGKSNLLMPLPTPDRDTKLYFTANLSDVTNLEAMFAIMTVDADKIYQECSFAEFASTIGRDIEAARKKWMKLINSNKTIDLGRTVQPVFRGINKDKKVSSCPFLGEGYEQGRDTRKLGYSELVSSLKRLPENISGTKELSNEHKSEFASICDSLSNVDKNHLLLELMKRIGDKEAFKNAIDAVVDKGKTCKLKIELRYKYNVEANHGERIHGDWHPYLVDTQQGKARRIKLEKTTNIIYIMNLIHKVKYPDMDEVADIQKNSEQFIKLYNELYGDEKGKEKYIKLFYSTDKKKHPLTDIYREITNSVNEEAILLGHDPAPYVVNLDKPLTLKADMIILPSSKELKILDSFLK